MTEPMLGPMFGDGARQLQDHFDSRRLADRIVSLTLHDALSDDDRALVEAQSSFLLATVDEAGWPDVSYKGGTVGLVRVLDERTVRFPIFDGNGMFRSLGNIVDNGKVAILFIDTSKPWRLRLHGVASVLTDAATVSSFHGAVAVVEVRIERLFPNCGRYVHAASGEISPYVPTPDHEPPQAEWKQLPQIRDVLPADQQSA